VAGGAVLSEYCNQLGGILPLTEGTLAMISVLFAILCERDVS
jgi:hypothetical protein